MIATTARQKGPAGPLLVNVALVLVVVGIVAVYDASYARSMDLRGANNDGFYYLKRQAVYAAIGLAAMLFAMKFHYARLRAVAGPLLLLSIVGLCLVWIPATGVVKNGAARWIGRGVLQFQPSELAKLALIIYLAALLSTGRTNIKSFGDGVLVPLLVVGLIVLLVEREPDLGTALIIGMGAITLIYLAGARLSHLAAVCAVGGVFVVAVSLFGHGFRQGRLTTFLNPEADYKGRGFQVTRGLLAVGSGGIHGVGIGAGREKFYLPEANTDFVFATIAEETGFVGGAIVVGLLFMIARQGFCIARRARDSFGSLLAAGIASIITWQALVNIAVVTGSIPATGVPLPFVSYGGTSLLFLLTGIGILLNIAQHGGDSLA